ncbi:MAG TPA: tol-pal system-associated acyl-CoA thioesterase [Stellaceae bacterium]|nr:tol-pal system-associated acyl-CoA thioesterase [Stellaceae bacterium]
MSAELPPGGVVVDGVHRFPLRVYYEDTDAAGIVYYANYLKFIERARTELMRRYGVEHEKARQSEGTAFIVRRAALEFLAPARLDDALIIETRIAEIGAATIRLTQDVRRGDELLVRADILVATVGRQGRPVRLPPALRSALHSRHETSRMVTANAR